MCFVSSVLTGSPDTRCSGRPETFLPAMKMTAGQQAHDRPRVRAATARFGGGGALDAPLACGRCGNVELGFRPWSGNNIAPHSSAKLGPDFPVPSIPSHAILSPLAPSPFPLPNVACACSTYDRCSALLCSALACLPAAEKGSIRRGRNITRAVALAPPPCWLRSVGRVQDRPSTG